MKTPNETMTVSSCCGASPTEYCNEDTGFCDDCRDHCDFIDVCVECSEEDCTCTTFTDGTPVITDGGIIQLEDEEDHIYQNYKEPDDDELMEQMGVGPLTTNDLERKREELRGEWLQENPPTVTQDKRIY